MRGRVECGGMDENRTTTKASMFSFTIRELFMLTLIVGLALGWWLDHRRMAWKYDAMVASLEVLLRLDPSERPTIEELQRAGEEVMRSGN